MEEDPYGGVGDIRVDNYPGDWIMVTLQPVCEDNQWPSRARLWIHTTPLLVYILLPSLCRCAATATSIALRAEQLGMAQLTKRKQLCVLLRTLPEACMQHVESPPKMIHPSLPTLRNYHPVVDAVHVGRNPQATSKPLTFDLTFSSGKIPTPLTREANTHTSRTACMPPSRWFYLSCVSAKCQLQQYPPYSSTCGLPVLAGLGLAVSVGDVAGLGETETGGGIRPASPSLDECTYSWGLGMGDAGTAGNAVGDSAYRAVE